MCNHMGRNEVGMFPMSNLNRPKMSHLGVWEEGNVSVFSHLKGWGGGRALLRLLWLHRFERRGSRHQF